MSSKWTKTTKQVDGVNRKAWELVGSSLFIVKDSDNRAQCGDMTFRFPFIIMGPAGKIAVATTIIHAKHIAEAAWEKEGGKDK